MEPIKFYSMTSIFNMSVVFILSWAITSEPVFAYLIIGSIINIILCYLFKWMMFWLFGSKCFIYRPSAGENCGFWPDDKATISSEGCRAVIIPSLFSQFFGFVAMFLILFIILNRVELFGQITTVFLILVYSLFMSYMQYYKHCESFISTLGSYVLGAIIGTGWYFIINSLNVL